MLKLSKTNFFLYVSKNFDVYFRSKFLMNSATVGFCLKIRVFGKVRLENVLIDFERFYK